MGGLPGAVAATMGAFLMPWLLAALTAQQATRWAQHPALRRFGAGATPAVIGLLGVTALTLVPLVLFGPAGRFAAGLGHPPLWGAVIVFLLAAYRVNLLVTVAMGVATVAVLRALA